MTASPPYCRDDATMVSHDDVDAPVAFQLDPAAPVVLGCELDRLVIQHEANGPFGRRDGAVVIDRVENVQWKLALQSALIGVVGESHVMLLDYEHV